MAQKGLLNMDKRGCWKDRRAVPNEERRIQGHARREPSQQRLREDVEGKAEQMQKGKSGNKEDDGKSVKREHEGEKERVGGGAPNAATRKYAGI